MSTQNNNEIMDVTTTAIVEATAPTMEARYELSTEPGAGSLLYCSMTATSREEKAVLFNATASTPEHVSDHINEVLEVKDIFAEVVTLVSDKTGEVVQVPRIVLISPDGVGYAAVSMGVYSAVSKILHIFGDPSAWEAPLRVKVKQITKGENKILNLEVVG